ncbi:glutamine--tRNA ligase-like [Penaeus chinensis]|uniref:glutamine--tRNA ligase-like n=1 Tax=Penaeus chinensis TaxID=139456 RepID=UPI001FB5B9A6|nr:glutamine--tRNA ligase-like [Penaeus chinensis]
MIPGRFVNGEFVLTDSQRKGMSFRFAPEPNGPLHIGHVKTFRTNFNCAAENGGQMILRFDDTNPETASVNYCEDAKEMLQWLGYDISAFRTTFTSDYFEVLLQHARTMIKKGLAYVCHEDSVSSAKASPWKDRSIEENICEFERMVNYVYPKGKAVLRLKYEDKYFKDPVAYRIKQGNHFRTKDRWAVYPSYDFSHPIVDSIENIAVSICTMEFAHHRVLYNWIQEKLNLPLVPQQEQPRLSLENVVLSKRKLINLHRKGALHDMADPRLATLAGLRSRGIPPKAIEKFVAQGFREFAQLLDIVRKELLPVAEPYKMVLDPLYCRVVNYVEGKQGAENPQEPFTEPHFFISGLDFDDDDTSDDSSPHILSVNRPASLFGLPYKITVKKVERHKGKIKALAVTLTLNDKVRGLRSLVWVPAPSRATLVYLDHIFTGSDLQPAPIRYAQIYAEPGFFSSVKTGEKFIYGQTFRAVNIGYVTVSQRSTEHDVLLNVTCFLKHKPEHLENILKCFTSTPSP